MPRQKNQRNTIIYWLIDVRPETIESGWCSGKPFYCGKTIGSTARRLRSHVHTAAKWPRRKLSLALKEIGAAYVLRTMEIVPPETDWCNRERHWIRMLRHLNPSCANTADGGQGATGYIPTPEHRAKLRITSTGRKHSADALEKMRRPRQPKNWIFTPEHRAKLSEANKQSPRAIAQRAKLRASLKGRPFSESHRQNMSTARKKSSKAMAVALANLEAITQKRRDEDRGIAAIMQCHGIDVFKRVGQQHLLPKRWRKCALKMFGAVTNAPRS